MNYRERTFQSGRSRRDWSMLDALLALALLMAGARADAQSTPAQASAAISQSSSAAPASRSDRDKLEEVIVTAEKRAEPLQRVPISVTVLSGKELDKQAAGGTLDALRLTPSISASDSDAGGLVQISIRGVAPAVAFGDSSTTVAYYVDGVPFASIRSAAVPQTSDYDLQQIEVLRGPQGTLYGASALAGVVHIITNDADPTQFYGKARLGMASTEGGDLSYRGDAALNVPLVQDKLAVRLVVGYDHQGGWIEQPNLNRDNANYSNLTSVRAKIDYRPTDNLKVDLTAWHSDFRENAANYGIDDKQSLTYNPSPSTTQYDAYNAKIVYDLPSVSLSSSTSYMHLNQNAYTDYDNEIGTITMNSLDELHLYLPSSTFTEEFLVSSRNTGAWRWQSGAFYRNEHDDAFHAIAAFFGPSGNITWRDGSKSEAVFGQVTRVLDDGHVEVTGGARYFHDEFFTETLPTPGEVLPILQRSNTSSSVTPRAVLAWLPNANTNIYASYSVGFRSGLEQSPFVLVVAPQFPPAKPDRLKNYEIGAKGSLFNHLVTYDASVFYVKWLDIQQNGELQYCTTPTTCAPLGGTVNGVSASGTGFDLAVGFHPMRGLNFGFNIDENDLANDAAVYPNGVGAGPNNGAVYLKGDRTPFSAKWTANAYVDYSWPLSGNIDAKLQLSDNYRSSQLLILAYNSVGGINYRPCNNGNYCYESDSPQLVNASFELATHHNQALTFYATNLTNWSGLTIPAASANTTFRTRPRTFGLQFDVKF